MSDDLNLCYYACAFLDVLGQRSRLRDLRGVPTNADQKALAATVLGDTVGVITALREEFRRFFEGAARSSIDLESLPPGGRELFKQIRRLELKLRGFSDSIVISTSLRGSTEECTPINGIFATMYGLSGMVIGALAGRHALRGGIDVGWGVEIEPGEVYGAALERAHLLESSHAGYPRILIGAELMRYLGAVLQEGGDEPRQRYARGMASECNRFITMDTDGLPILDFLGEGVREKKVPALERAVEAAYAFILAEEKRMRASGDLKLQARYGRLRYYFELRLPLWGVKVRGAGTD